MKWLLTINMYEDILNRLSKSKFRNSFHLKFKDKEYIKNKGIEVIKTHAYDFVTKRLSSNNIVNDGKQTPFKGHPVFVAQHATATCCRGCISKWHKIPENIVLNETQIEHIVNLIITWIIKEMNNFQ